MANRKRGRPKQRRAGCLLCKPHKLSSAKKAERRRLVDWLRSCPEGGWFVEIESESTDSLDLGLVAHKPLDNTFVRGRLGRLREDVRVNEKAPIKDSLVAGTALAHDLAVVTLNRREFDAAGVVVVDPAAEPGRLALPACSNGSDVRRDENDPDGYQHHRAPDDPNHVCVLACHVHSAPLERPRRRFLPSSFDRRRSPRIEAAEGQMEHTNDDQDQAWYPAI